MLKIEFEEPTHGWLPVKITLNDIEECFEASDIPLNPISQLQAYFYNYNPENPVGVSEDKVLVGEFSSL